MANFLNIDYSNDGIIKDGTVATLVNIDTIKKIELFWSSSNNEKMKVYFKDGTEIECNHSNMDEFNGLFNCSSTASSIDIYKTIYDNKEKFITKKDFKDMITKLIFSNYIIAIIILIGLLCTH